MITLGTPTYNLPPYFVRRGLRVWICISAIRMYSILSRSPLMTACMEGKPWKPTCSLPLRLEAVLFCLLAELRLLCCRGRPCSSSLWSESLLKFGLEMEYGTPPGRLFFRGKSFLVTSRLVLCRECERGLSNLTDGPFPDKRTLPSTVS